MIQRTQAAIRDEAQCWQIVLRLLRETAAHRVIVLYTEDGGGIPGPDRVIYSSARYEASDGALPPVMDDWQKRRVDAAYAGMLAEVLQKGAIVLRPSEMEEGVLRATYRTQGVVRSDVQHITTLPKQVYYLSVNFMGDTAGTASRDGLAIAAARDQLRVLIERASKAQGG